MNGDSYVNAGVRFVIGDDEFEPDPAWIGSWSRNDILITYIQ